MVEQKTPHLRDAGMQDAHDSSCGDPHDTKRQERCIHRERERDKFVASRLEMGTAINPGMYKYLYVCVHIYIYTYVTPKPVYKAGSCQHPRKAAR